MQHFVETTTFRRDGRMVVERIICESSEEAEQHFQTQLSNYWPTHQGWQNDFGETVLIQVTKYGHGAQVKAGTFVLF